MDDGDHAQRPLTLTGAIKAHDPTTGAIGYNTAAWTVSLLEPQVLAPVKALGPQDGWGAD